MRLTNLQRLDKYPPWFIRMMARQGDTPLTNEQLAKRSGWSVRRWTRLASAESFANMTVKDVDTFFTACNAADPRRDRWLLQLAIRRGGIEHLRHLQKGRIAAVMRSVHARRLKRLFSK